ncbi:MAG: hypothetical protein RMZ41_018280 [Nostoc sp. DedVER02]|nr:MULTISPECIES: hypothetical protein [unclassified Nostoc]MDZ7988901.1 hypothetical protein [Nostoc sp. DedVER02]MDZ8112514.1 hypothetical protein [Nostoc sp. DedVER01b]
MLAPQNSNVYDGLFGVAYLSREMITYEFDRRYTIDAAQYYFLRSVS